MKFNDASEIVLGLIIQGKIDPEHVNPSQFYPPYGDAVKLLRGHADIADLYDKIGLVPIKAAIEAAQVVGDKDP